MTYPPSARRPPAPGLVAGGGLSAEGLSQTAELLLLAIDPAKGGLFPHHRRRFRRALAHTHQADRGDGRTAVWGAGRARREAVRELERLGLVEPKRVSGRLRLADPSRAGKRFHQLVGCVLQDELSDPRDRVLLLLLAGSGVLAHRLSRQERRLAARRLRTLVRAHQRAGPIPPAHGSGPPMSDVVAVLARRSARDQDDQLEDLLDMGEFGVSDLSSGDFGGSDSGGGDSGGGSYAGGY